MSFPLDFFRCLIDALPENIVVTDCKGAILYTNRSWKVFGECNGCSIGSEQWHEVNYFQTCLRSAAMGEHFGLSAYKGLQQVVSDPKSQFYMEYPCHSPDEQRWFLMRVVSLTLNADAYLVISHQNITQRKLAEEKVAQLAQVDALTNIANRRRFDEYYENQWQRCQRDQQYLSLVMIDIDHFKQFNDQYGHLAGDECLKQVASLLSHYAQRPSDLCARYGGEEFMLVFPNTPHDHSVKLMNQLLMDIRNLVIRQSDSNTDSQITLSIGLLSLVPTSDHSPLQILKQVDGLLYDAKKKGRDRMIAKAIN